MSKIFVSQIDEFNVYQALKRSLDFLKIDFNFNVAAINLNTGNKARLMRWLR